MHNVPDLSATLERLRALLTELHRAWRDTPGYLIKRHSWPLGWLDRLRTRSADLDFDIVLPAQRRRLHSLRRAEAANLRRQYKKVLEKERFEERQERERQKSGTGEK